MALVWQLDGFGPRIGAVDGNLATTKLTVTKGTVGVTLGGGATISAGANNSGSVTLSGTQAQINAALATLSYKGNSNFTGSDSFNYRVFDTTGFSATATVTTVVTVENSLALRLFVTIVQSVMVYLSG